MSSDAADSDASDSIPIHTRALDRLERQNPVILKYRSNRGNKEKKEARGVITSVQALGNGKKRFRFYDEEEERKLVVTLNGTFEDSSVKSKKTGRPTTIGSPLLVLASEESDSPDALHQEYLLGKRDSTYDTVVAAAAITTFENEVRWVQAVNQQE